MGDGIGAVDATDGVLISGSGLCGVLSGMGRGIPSSGYDSSRLL